MNLMRHYDADVAIEAMARYPYTMLGLLVVLYERELAARGLPIPAVNPPLGMWERLRLFYKGIRGKVTA